MGGIVYGMCFISGVLEIFDYMMEYFLNVWMLNYLNLVVIVVEVMCCLWLMVCIYYICDMFISIEEVMVKILYYFFVVDLEICYYGFNYFGWWSLVCDKVIGEDLMLKLVEYVR